MNNEEELLETWWWSAGRMHIAHHLAAARYAKFQKYLGGLSVALSAIVSSALFIAVKESAEKGNDQNIIMIVGLISLAGAIIGGINSFLKFDQRINQHYRGAVSFQYIRRLIEEELVFCKKGKSKDSYDFIIDHWQKALKDALPLPQDIYKKAGIQLQKEHEESLTRISSGRGSAPLK